MGLSRERIIIGKLPGTAIAGCDGYRWEKNPREEEETCKAKRVEWVLIDLSKALGGGGGGDVGSVAMVCNDPQRGCLIFSSQL